MSPKALSPRAIAGIATALVVALGATIYVTGLGWRTTLYVANGLPLPVVATVGGRSVRVEAEAWGALSVPRGLVTVTTATEDGRAIETLVVDADGSADAVVYDVLGAAPVISAEIVYAARGTNPDSDMTFLGGASSAVVRDADYVFEEPPESLSVDSKSGVTRRQAVMLVPGGWGATWQWLRSNGRAEDAVDLAVRVAPWLPEPDLSLHYVTRAARDAYGPGATAAVVAPLLGTPGLTPETVALVAIADACRADRCGEGRALVAAAQLDHGDALATSLRYLPEAEGRAALAELATLPEHKVAGAAALAWQARVEGRWDDCLRWLAPLTGADAEEEVDVRAECLAGAGRTPEALEALEAAVTANGPYAQPLALSYAVLAKAAGLPADGPIRSLWKSSGDDLDRNAAWLEIWLGSLDEDGPSANVLSVGEGQTYARRVLEGLPPSTVPADFTFPDTLLVLAAGELFRQGDLDGGARTLAQTARFPLGSDETLAYVAEGVEPSRFYRLHPELRAALELVRARRLEQLGDEAGARRLFEASRLHDPFHGWVRRAAAAWPAPGEVELVVYTSGP